MPKFDVFLTATATFGVVVDAASAEEAEAIAERELHGPKHADGIDFGTWDVAFGATEQCGPPVTFAADKPCPAHKTVQHRDRKRPWCNTCGRAADGELIGRPNP